MRVYKRTAAASVTFCKKKKRRRERADDIKKSRRERYIVRDDLVPLTGLEPVRIIHPRDFKSLVSADSTTAAYGEHTKVRLIMIQQTVCFVNKMFRPKCNEKATKIIIPIQLKM